MKQDNGDSAVKHLDYNRHEVSFELQSMPHLQDLEKEYKAQIHLTKVVTTIYFGAKSDLWEGVRPLVDFGFALKARFYNNITPSNLFLADHEAVCVIELKSHTTQHGYNIKVKTDSNSGVTYGSFIEYLAHFNQGNDTLFDNLEAINESLLEFAAKNGITEFVPIGASNYQRQHFLNFNHRICFDTNIRYYVASFHDEDVIFSLASAEVTPILEIKKDSDTPLDELPIIAILSRGNITYKETKRSKGVRISEHAKTRHTFFEPELDEKAYDDWIITEREIKLDAPSDPRGIAKRVALGDKDKVFSGQPIINMNYQKVYNVGESGIVYMSADLEGQVPMLKYKFFLGNDEEGALVRKETVIPFSSQALADVALELDPSADLSTVVVTPFFRRDRIKVNIYMPETRNVFEVYADHSSFTEGNYHEFNQVEIEYAGLICEEDSLRPDQSELEYKINNDFIQLRRIILDVYKRNDSPLTPSTRTKYDWANKEVFAKNTPSNVYLNKR